LYNLKRTFELITISNDFEPYKYGSYDRFVTHLEEQEKKVRGNYFDTIENEINEDEKVLKGHLDFKEKLTNEMEELLDKKYVFDQSNRLFNFESVDIS